jgi:hypothetical protein
MTKLTLRALQRLAATEGRHADGEGLFLRVVDDDHRFWTYRYRLDGKETELSLGPCPRRARDDAQYGRAARFAAPTAPVRPRRTAR